MSLAAPPCAHRPPPPPPPPPPPQVLTRDDASIWQGLSAAARQGLKAELLNVIKEEQMRAVTKKVRCAAASSPWRRWATGELPAPHPC